MANTPWLESLRNDIEASTLETASQSINVDGIVNEVCIARFVWRYHADLNAWIYATRKVHRVLFYLIEIHIYRVASKFANTFCISQTEIKGALSYDWICVYLEVPKPLGVLKPLRKNSSSDLSSMLSRLRQKRRSNSLCIW
ncbi:MAG: hypothetical protein CMP20_01625 [Rickettsiales bacterium]|nr:hypothetical protein [Rickettsiales bacterium]